MRGPPPWDVADGERQRRAVLRPVLEMARTLRFPEPRGQERPQPRRRSCSRRRVGGHPDRVGERATWLGVRPPTSSTLGSGSALVRDLDGYANCRARCITPTDYEQRMTLTATADPGLRLHRLDGHCYSASGNRCEVRFDIQRASGPSSTEWASRRRRSLHRPRLMISLRRPRPAACKVSKGEGCLVGLFASAATVGYDRAVSMVNETAGWRTISKRAATA